MASSEFACLSDVVKQYSLAETLADQLLSKSVEFAELVNSLDSDFLTPQVKDNLLDGCESVLKCQADCKASRDALCAIKDFAVSQEAPGDNFLEQIMEKFSETKQSAADSYKKSIHQNTHLQSLKHSLRKAETNGTLARHSATDISPNDEDCESVIVHQTNKMIDPMTKKEIVYGVINVKCKHFYEKDIILQILNTYKKQRKRPKCFHIGCNNELNSEDFADYRA